MTNDFDLRKKALMDELDPTAPKAGFTGLGEKRASEGAAFGPPAGLDLASIGQTTMNRGVGAAAQQAADQLRSRMAAPTGGAPLDQPMPAPAAPDPMGPAAPSPMNTSAWNTDGFAKPGYTAKAGVPSLGSGWDEQKWNDPNHQTPKYVFGRILQEASGGDGRLQTPQEREQAVGNILKAYPGATFDGKDKITMPDGGVIDIFGGAGSGDYTAAFQLQEGTGKDASGRPLPRSGGGGAGGGMPFGGAALDGALGGDPLDKIQQAIAQMSGGRPNLDELLKQLGQ